jgi:hypothetical protein
VRDAKIVFQMHSVPVVSSYANHASSELVGSFFLTCAPRQTSGVLN